MTEVDTPRPEAGELLVRVASSSVNGFDTATAAGYLQGMMEHRFPLGRSKPFAKASRDSRSGTRSSAWS